MLVLDASATLEWLLGRPAGDGVAARLTRPGESVHVPHLWSVEVAQVLRRFTSSGTITANRGRQALAVVSELPAVRYPHEPLLGRAWQLRDNVTAYDAVYVALAEALNAPLLTTDGRLAAAPGHRATIETV